MNIIKGNLECIHDEIGLRSTYMMDIQMLVEILLDDLMV